MKKKMLKKKDINTVLNLLLELYPDAKAELDFTNPFELLIATILSAQCTDVQVNKTTAELFKDYKSPEDFLTLTEEELGRKIYSCGFYKNKSKNILETSRILVSQYDSQVPETIEELMTLPGVGRKTANVVVSNAFGIPAIAVDTHVFRVSNRIGLADSKNVEVQAELFSKLVAKTTTETITLTLKESSLEVKGNGTYNIELPLDE